MSVLKNRPLPLVLAVLLMAVSAVAEPDLDRLTSYIEEARASWGVPGMAVAIVHNDKVVYARGFGVRTLGQKGSVDENTLFAIGSCSKAFTAAALGMLVDEGSIGWDDRVTDRLPGFELHDFYATRELTIRDILSHRSGLPRGDAIWYGTTFNRSEVLRRIRYIEPNSSFRSRYEYQNIMFLAAGQIVPAVTNLTWDEFIDKRFFTPLGMSRSSTTVRDLPRSRNVASPHEKFDGEWVLVPYRNIDNIAPAGSINSSVAEMAQWLRLNLNRGFIDGTRLISEETIAEMQSPHTIIPLEGLTQQLHPDSNFVSYGLAWDLSDYNGRKLIRHGGGIDGMHTHVALIPEENLGVVVLSNTTSSFLPFGVAYRVIDMYLGLPERDWGDEFGTIYNDLIDLGKEVEEERLQKRAKNTSPSLDPSAYIGTYESPAYGKLEITLDGGNLSITRGPSFDGPLTHWHFDTFIVKWTDPTQDRSFFTFSLNTDGKIVSVNSEALGEFKRIENEE